jgi:hypothetical protein
VRGPGYRAGQPAAQGANPQGTLSTGIIRNMVLVNSVFHALKNFIENYLQFGHAPSKFLQPVPGCPHAPTGPVCEI